MIYKVAAVLVLGAATAVVWQWMTPDAAPLCRTIPGPHPVPAPTGNRAVITPVLVAAAVTRHDKGSRKPYHATAAINPTTNSVTPVSIPKPAVAIPETAVSAPAATVHTKDMRILRRELPQVYFEDLYNETPAPLPVHREPLVRIGIRIKRILLLTSKRPIMKPLPATIWLLSPYNHL